MSHEDRGDAEPLDQLPDLAASSLPKGGIEIGERLVEQQDPGLWSQGPGQSNPLLLATRELSDTAALEAVTHGTNGILAGLHSGATFVEMSTVSPEAIRALGAEVAKRGASLLDAPVSGSIATLEAGQLSIMVAGDAGALERARPYLTAIGPTIIHVGELGLAKTMKIATNLSLAVQMLAFSEAVLLAEKAGITRESAVDVLVKSVIASPMIKYRGPFVLNMPDEAWFDVNMMQKDMLLALELGRELDVSLPTTAITNEMLTAARALGLAKKDFAIVFEVLARMSGVRDE